jgi:hypothetical protein
MDLPGREAGGAHLSPLAATLHKTAALLQPHRDALVEAWQRELGEARLRPGDDLRRFCTERVDGMLASFAKGDVDGLLAGEGRPTAPGDHSAPVSSSRRYSASPVGSLTGSLRHGVSRFSREFALQLEHEPRSLTMQPASSSPERTGDEPEM